MNFYTAFMRAADKIESGEYSCDIGRSIVPCSPMDEGCVLGWVAFEMGAQFIETLPKWDFTIGGGRCAADSTGVTLHLGLRGRWQPFSDRMAEIATSLGMQNHWGAPENVTRVMREYARQYLKPPVDPILAGMLKNMDAILRPEELAT